MFGYKTFALIATVFVVLVFFISNFDIVPKFASRSDAAGPTTEQVSEMVKLLNELGPEQAYQAVLHRAENDYSFDPHVLGHDYGHAAFLLNIDPALILTICRTELLYGCLHEFIGQLLYTHGLEHITELERLCLNETHIKLYLGCMHGLGHGLLAYAGYNESNLFEVVKYCDNVFYGDYTMGCHGGVFMEYNSRNLIGEGPRVISDNDPYNPCVDKGKYTDSCIFWLPLLWKSSLPNASSQKMMNLCSHFPGSAEEKASCYEGVGRTMVATSTESFTYTASQCDTAGQVSDEAWLGCRWAAMRDYRSIPEEINQDLETRCIGLSGVKHEICLAYMKQKVDFYNEATDQLRERREKTLVQ